METVFISTLEPLLDAIAEKRLLYTPRRVDNHCVYRRYERDAWARAEFNPIRPCTPVKEFLFPLRELAAAFPMTRQPDQVGPFAVFGLKACDLRSIDVLDKVFLEAEFEDPFYIARRQQMFVISSDCTEPGETCFCTMFEGGAYAESGFDLNVSPVKDGFVIQAGSSAGRSFLFAHTALFGEVPDALLAERSELRGRVETRLKELTAPYALRGAAGHIVEKRYESDLFDELAKTCVECQACTRICPTCHCFYLYDTKQQDYFSKMKMWDSCMRVGYAQVAGGANPRKMLGDRLRHRLMHKFGYFKDRYGVEMCVGCGRCVDAETGEIDIRVVLKKLSDESVDTGRKVAKAGK